jgi:hypothetical protein
MIKHTYSPYTLSFVSPFSLPYNTLAMYPSVSMAAPLGGASISYKAAPLEATLLSYLMLHLSIVSLEF